VAGVATGGNAGNGATGGIGGAAGASGGSACASGVEMPLMGFDADLEGWSLIASASDTGVLPVEPSAIDIAWTGGDGMPMRGAIEASIPYSQRSQWVSFGARLPAPLDLSGKALTLCVKLVSGLGHPLDLMVSPGGAKLYAKSGANYCYSNGPYNNVGDMSHPVGEWMMLIYSFARPPDYVDPSCVEPFDPSDVREIGVQLDTSSTTMTAQRAIYRIDTLVAAPVLRSEDGAPPAESL
jgi:hypothetical protein